MLSEQRRHSQEHDDERNHDREVDGQRPEHSIRPPPREPTARHPNHPHVFRVDGQWSICCWRWDGYHVRCNDWMRRVVEVGFEAADYTGNVARLLWLG